MHRMINNTPEGFDTDHISGNKLDNRKSNLRTATRSENVCNRKVRPDSSTGVKGVRFHKQHKRYQARITKNKKQIHLGYFSTPETAHAAYCEAAKKLQGEFAHHSTTEDA